MWSKSYSTKVRDVTAEQLWRVFVDVNRWHIWDGDLDYARLEGEFAVGNSFLLKPKGGPKVKIQLVEVVPNRTFTDRTKFPLAEMFGQHDFVEADDGVEIKTTIRLRGPLAFVWRKLVAEGIVAGLADQTESLIRRARDVREGR
jgi:hypothetical protein